MIFKTMEDVSEKNYNKDNFNFLCLFICRKSEEEKSELRVINADASLYLAILFISFIPQNKKIS